MIETYKTYLEALNKADPYSISKGIAFYKGLFFDCGDAAIKDKAFWALRDFYADVMVKARSHPVIKEYIDFLNHNRVPSSSITVHSAHYRTLGDVYVQDIPLSEHVKAIFHDNGFHVYQDEGHYYLHVEPKFLFDQFSTYLPQASLEYLKEEAVNDEEGFTNDMALIISWERLGERVIFFEKFSRKYPDFIKKDWVEDSFCLYLVVLLHGTDNSCPFEDMDEVRKVYKKYIDGYYPKFASAVLLQKYYGILKKNGFKKNDAVKSFLSQIPYGRPERVQWGRQLVKDSVAL